jgi:hypothetical protein
LVSWIFTRCFYPAKQGKSKNSEASQRAKGQMNRNRKLISPVPISSYTEDQSNNKSLLIKSNDRLALDKEIESLLSQAKELEKSSQKTKINLFNEQGELVKSFPSLFT